MSFVRLRGKIAGAAVAVVLAWLLVPRRAQREELIEAAWVEERAADMRSTHVAVPLPRTFGELLEPSLAALHESYAAYKRSGPAAMNRVKRICNGQDPIAQLGPEMSVDLVQHRAAMHGALTATHARSARAPASLRLFAALRPDDAFADVQQAGRLAALDVLTLVDQGRAAEAAYECADMLALGRDLSYPSILGRMIGVAVTGASSYACGSALSLAPAGALEGVRAQLIAIRAGTPRFADLLRRERLFQQLWLADPDPRLPEGALTLIVRCACAEQERVRRPRTSAVARERAGPPGSADRCIPRCPTARLARLRRADGRGDAAFRVEPDGPGLIRPPAPPPPGRLAQDRRARLRRIRFAGAGANGRSSARSSGVPADRTGGEMRRAGRLAAHPGRRGGAASVGHPERRLRLYRSAGPHPAR